MEKEILEQYVEQLKQQKEEAFDVIYDTYKNLIYFCMYQITKDASTSEDLLQEAFIKMYENINLYKQNTNFKAWFVKLAKNIALNYLRNKKETVIYEDKTQRENKDFEKETFEVIKHLETFLSKEETEVVILKIIYDFTHQEIANTLDKPLGTILWMYQKAVQKMKKYY